MVVRKADSALVRRRQPGLSVGRACRWRRGVGPRGRCEGSAGVASLLSVSRWGVAGNRQRAVFCQVKGICSPRLIAFNGCGRSVLPSVPRRHQDMKHER
jgi:hypothetical protein